MDVETLLSQPRLAYYSESTPVDIYVCDIGEETHGQELVLVLAKLQVICKATFSQIQPFPRFHDCPRQFTCSQQGALFEMAMELKV